MEREEVDLDVDGEFHGGCESNNSVTALSVEIDPGMNVGCNVLVSFSLICGG